MKCPPEVTVEIHRFKGPDGNWLFDRNGNCITVRSQAKILLGGKDVLLGSIILTNAGPFKLKGHPEWKAFREGKGDKSIITGVGKAEPALRIIIDVIEQAHQNICRVLPNGYVNVYHVSNVICSKKEEIPFNHHLVEQAIYQRNLPPHLLMCKQLKNFESLVELSRKSPFIIMGFTKGNLKAKSRELIDLSKTFRNVVYVEDSLGWWTHPYRWGPFPELKQEAIQKLMKVLENNPLARVD